MKSAYQKFKDLHQTGKPFLLGNVWNVESAKAQVKSGIKALGTSSAAVAHSLGYEDGENMPFEAYLFIISRIRHAVDIPLSVDLESGYGSDIEDIMGNLIKLASIGVVGINIEDSKMVGDKRVMTETGIFSVLLKELMARLKQNKVEMFINVRTDAFLLDLPQKTEETIHRVKKYEEAGADGIFIPGITTEAAMSSISKVTDLPINVMSLPDLPDLHRLEALGISRISTGDFIFSRIYKEMENICRDIQVKRSFSPVFVG